MTGEPWLRNDSKEECMTDKGVSIVFVHGGFVDGSG